METVHLGPLGNRECPQDRRRDGMLWFLLLW